MNRLGASLWWAGLVFAAGAVFAGQADNQPDVRPDPRLDQPISAAVAYDSLEEFCARLTRLSAGGESAVGAGLRPDGDSYLYPQGSDALDAAERGDSGTGGLASAEQVTVPSSSGEPGYPVEITCDPAIREHKVVVRVKEQPLREVMRQIAVLFDFMWRQGPQEHPRYHVVQSEARAQLAHDLRARHFAERDGRYRRTVRNAIAAAMGPAEKLCEVASVDPDAAAMATLMYERCRSFGALTESGFDALFDGGVVRIPFVELSAELQDAVRDGFRRERVGMEERQRDEDWSWDTARLLYGRVEKVGFPWAFQGYLLITASDQPAQNLIKRLTYFHLRPGWTLWSSCADALAEYEDRPPSQEFYAKRYERLRRLETECGIDVLAKARSEGTEVVPEWARVGDAQTRVHASRELVPIALTPAGGKWQLPLLLLEVAERLDVNLVADCYWTRSVFAGFPGPRDTRLAPTYPAIRDESEAYCIDANPEYTLDRIVRQRASACTKDGDFFRVRSLLWFVDDAEEVPASVLNEWIRRTDGEKRITVDDYLYLVSNLSPEQARNISATSYRGAPGPGHSESPLSCAAKLRDTWYDALKLYAMLPPGLRVRAERTGIHINTELPDALVSQTQRLLQGIQQSDPEFASERPNEERERILGELRLWAGIRKHLREGLRFCVEFWSGGEPHWEDYNELVLAPTGRMWSWWFPLTVKD